MSNYHTFLVKSDKNTTIIPLIEAGQVFNTRDRLFSGDCQGSELKKKSHCPTALYFDNLISTFFVRSYTNGVF